MKQEFCPFFLSRQEGKKRCLVAGQEYILEGVRKPPTTILKKVEDAPCFVEQVRGSLPIEIPAHVSKYGYCQKCRQNVIIEATPLTGTQADNLGIIYPWSSKGSKGS